MDSNNGYIIAFEVKDKPVLAHHLQSSIEKAVTDHSLCNLAFVAINKQQKAENFDKLVRWAAARGVKITIFTNWQDLYQACKCFAQPTDTTFEGVVFRRLLTRGFDLGVARTGLEALGRIAIVPVDS